MTAISALQQMVMSTLKQDSGLMTKLRGGLHDGMPADTSQGIVFPYAVFSQATETPWNAHDRKGRQVTFLIQVFSKYRGGLEAQDIAGDVIDLLDLQHASLSVTGWTLAMIALEMNEELVEAPDLRQRTLRFRARVEVADEP